MFAVPLLSILALLQASLDGWRQRPVWDGTLPPAVSVRGNLCNVAVITGLPRGRVFVRNGPSQSSRPSDAIEIGTRVYVCNSARYWNDNRSREWFGIAYRSSGKPCRGATNEGLDVRLSRQCRTGWVNDQWVTVLSG